MTEHEKTEGKVTVETPDTKVSVDGPVMPREFYEHLQAIYQKIGRIEKALIVLAILAGPKFVASAIDVVTSTAQAAMGH